MTMHIQSNLNLFQVLTEATWCLHWVTYLNPKCHLCIIYTHFPVIQSDIFGVFGKVCVVTRIWNTFLWICTCARTVHFNDNRPVGPAWFKEVKAKETQWRRSAGNKIHIQSHNPYSFGQGHVHLYCKGLWEGEHWTIASKAAKGTHWKESSSCLCKFKQSERTVD